MNQPNKRRIARLIGLLLVSSTPLTAAAVDGCDPAATYWTASCIAGCPDAAAFCAAVHQDPAGNPSNNTGYCAGQACFAGQTGLVKYGFLNPVVAQGAVGKYPTKWKVTLTEAAQLTFTNCDLRKLGPTQTSKSQTIKSGATFAKGTTLAVTVGTIPGESEPRCYFGLRPLAGSQLTDVIHHEHIAANGSLRCLGWLECSHSTTSPPAASSGKAITPEPPEEQKVKPDRPVPPAGSPPPPVPESNK